MQTMRWFKDAEQEKCFSDPLFRGDPVRMGPLGLSLPSTPPKSNMEPENWQFVDVSPFPRGYRIFLGPMLVSKGEYSPHLRALGHPNVLQPKIQSIYRDFCWAKCPLRCSIPKLNGKEESPLGKG